MLAGMPVPAELSRGDVDGRVVIGVGSTVLFDYAAGDVGMRKLAAVTLPGLGFTARRVAEVLGLSEEYVSMLRARARREGSAALVDGRGRPGLLSRRQLTAAREAREGGESFRAIGRRLGVHATTVARALGRAGEAGGESEGGSLAVQEPLAGSDVAGSDVAGSDVAGSDVAGEESRTPGLLGHPHN